MSPIDLALQSFARGESLSAEATSNAVDQILAGEVGEAKLASFLTALRVKGETAAELAGTVLAVRNAAGSPEFRVRPEILVDTCGTGGDGACTLNISTATAMVVAACGVAVAKHGNRAASGNSGSSEVLTELGVAIEPSREALDRCLNELGIAFLFAPKYHPGLRHAAPVRRQLPFKTIFNLVGPLCNPAGPTHQLIGVAGEASADLMAQTLATLGTTRSAVITGHGGLDEVTLDGPTKVRWVEGNTIRTSQWQPDEFGLDPVSVDELKVGSPKESARRIEAILGGGGDPGRKMILANAAAALFVSGQVAGLKEGVEKATQAIDSSTARTLLNDWARISNQYPPA